MARVFALGGGDVGDRAQDERGRHRQLDADGGDAERAADRARGRRAELCSRSLEAAGRPVPSDFTATSSAFISAASVAPCTAFCQRAGSIFMPVSTGEPSIDERRAAIPGFSRIALARRRSVRSLRDSPAIRNCRRAWAGLVRGSDESPAPLRAGRGYALRARAALPWLAVATARAAALARQAAWRSSASATLCAQLLGAHRLGQEAEDLRLVDELDAELGVGLVGEQDGEHVRALGLHLLEERDQAIHARAHVGDDRGDLVHLQHACGFDGCGHLDHFRIACEQALESAAPGPALHRSPAASRRCAAPGLRRGGLRSGELHARRHRVGEVGAKLVVFPRLLHEAEDLTFVDRADERRPCRCSP